MIDDYFKDNFKKNLKSVKESLIKIEEENVETLFENLHSEYKEECQTNIKLKFKNSLESSFNRIKSEPEVAPIFENVIQNIVSENLREESKIKKINFDIQKHTPAILEQDLNTLESDPVTSHSEFLIKAASESISKEEFIKPDSISENYNNSFSNPDVKSSDLNLKTIQNKVKFLEDWVTKISLAGPGSGEVNFRWLDDVNRNSIGNTDQILRYNPTDKKFFFGQLSGDQGPIRSLKFDVNGSGVPPVPQMLEWNTEKDCLNIHQEDNSILQVGLEQYIKVHNGTANTLTSGTLVQFSGVNGDSETPLCIPLLANSSYISLYTIGVLTNDIPVDGVGRATTFGEIRNLNASGSSSGEVWNVGDLLWASPIQPGKLAKVQPTAPNPVISVAAVLNSSNTNGIILVRPTIFPRLFYGSFYDTTTQVTSANTATAVKFSNTQISSGFHVSNNTQIVAEHAGLYNYQFSIQIDSTNSGSGQNIWIWYRKNGNDIPWTSSRLTVNKEYNIASWNFIESMEIGDFFQLMWLVDNSNIHLTAPADHPVVPGIPSAILTISQVNL